MAIADIDTRQLTRLLRTQRRAERLHRRPSPPAQAVTPAHDRRGGRARQGRAEHGRPRPGQGGVSVASPTSGPRPSGQLGTRLRQRRRRRSFHVVAFDYGVKRNILRMLAERGCRITVVPAQTPAADVLKLQARRHLPDQRPRRPGALRLRDRGDARADRRAACPTFGICLGHQIMALASGAKTFKMKFGHHGANHPVKDLDNGRVSITSQNHGFAVDEKTLPANLRADARVACSTARCRAWRAPTSRRSASRATRRPRPARTTSATCSTASSA